MGFKFGNASVMCCRKSGSLSLSQNILFCGALVLSEETFELFCFKNDKLKGEWSEYSFGIKTSKLNEDPLSVLCSKR